MIVSKFFIHQQQNKDAITDQITQVMMQLNEKQQLEIALHPDDLAFVQDKALTFGDAQQVHLKADARLNLGGCIITSEHGVFNASIERQIDNLKQVLLEMKSTHA